MKAALLSMHAGPDVFSNGDTPDPRPGPGEIVVDIPAASVNAADYKVRLGSYDSKMKFPYILGRDFSGVVSAVGQGADLKIGDEVFAVCDAGIEGAYAEKIAIKSALAAIKPAKLSHEEAAAMALTSLTAIWAIEDTAQLKKGETVLIQGGAGEVAGRLRSSSPSISARRASSPPPARATTTTMSKSLGADRIIDYNAEDFTKHSARICDVVFDTVGGEVQVRSYDAC